MKDRYEKSLKSNKDLLPGFYAYKTEKGELLPAWYIGKDKRYGDKTHNMYVLENHEINSVRVYNFDGLDISGRVLSKLENLDIREVPQETLNHLIDTFNFSTTLKRIMKEAKK